MLLQNSWNFQICSITCFTLSPESLSEREENAQFDMSKLIIYLFFSCNPKTAVPVVLLCFSLLWWQLVRKKKLNHISWLLFIYVCVCPTEKWWRGLWSIPSWMLLWRWLMMAARMVDRFITWAHWARPRVNSSFQQARTKLVFASWLRKIEKNKQISECHKIDFKHYFAVETLIKDHHEHEGCSPLLLPVNPRIHFHTNYII